MTTRHVIYAGAVLTVALSGCAAPATDSTLLPVVSASPAPSIETATPAPRVTTSEPATPKPATSKSALPTLRPPTAPPDEPTDQIKDTGWLVGTVTSGGTGPCYGLTTDEGAPYALYSAAGTNLAKGSRIRVKTRTAQVRIYCGPGKLLEMTVAQPLG